MEVMRDGVPVVASAGETAPDIEHIGTKDDAPAEPKTRKKRSDAGQTRTRTPRGRKGLQTFDQIEATLTGMMLQTSRVLYAFPATRADGAVIADGSGDFVSAWIKAAEADVRVHRALSTMTTGGVWGAVAIATAGLALPIMANHGLVPDFLAGLMVEPETQEGGENGD